MRSFWVDTDVALGARRGDVDDAFALAAVLASPGATVLGVSSVFGNTASTTAERCARELLDVAGSRATVVRGASHAGEVTTAAEAIAALPAGTTVLALGPLTNVAAALALDPSLASRIDVRFVGGNPSSLGRWPPYWPFEFNLAKDPGAARAVIGSATPRTACTLDVCADLTVGPRDLASLAGGGALARALARGSWRWLAYTPLRYRALRFPAWDLVPALDALGLLGAPERVRRVRVRGRGLLVDDPGAPETRFVGRFDPRAAWSAFRALV